MESTFRKSMSWLHTWSGLTMCAVLFAIFWMGTLSVFDSEIDRWMMPMTRLAPPSGAVSFDEQALPILRDLAPHSQQWNVSQPTDRNPVLRLSWRDVRDESVDRFYDPATLAPLADPGTLAGDDFIYPFHYRLHIRFMDIGEWLVGIATMGMLVAIVSGVVIHKKIFRDFFTFRPRSKTTQRTALDLHNLSSVVALPFHFVIALSGLVIFFTTYFPAGWQAAYGPDREPFNEEASGRFTREPAGRPGTLASLDAMAAEARRLWGDGRPEQLRVWYPGDANAYVEVGRSYDDSVARDRQTIYFDGATGAMLARSDYKPVKDAQEFIEGLHRIQFSHWTLRWLYFAAGLGGCLMIATGFFVWIEARKVQHAKKGLAGARMVEALAVGSVTGIVAATLVFFVVNRLLPLDAHVGGTGRAALEVWAFYLAWLASFAHAARRGRPAWSEQSLAIALLAIAAVLLNWLTTGDHFLRSLNGGPYAVAGVDLLLLLAAGIGWISFRRLRRRVGTGAVSRRLRSRDSEASEVGYG